jgi:hypothetical protein
MQEAVAAYFLRRGKKYPLRQTKPTDDRARRYGQ